jgi:hypothetical protein
MRRNVVALTHSVEWSVVKIHHFQRSRRVGDWVDAVAAGAHGIHVKEMHRHRIPDIRRQFRRTGRRRRPTTTCTDWNIRRIIVESAISAFGDYIDPGVYFFVSTCCSQQCASNAGVLEGPGSCTGV